MSARTRKLWVAFYTPMVVIGIRILLTLIVLIWNPWHLSLPVLQLIPVIVLLVTLFMYTQFFTDGVPVVSLLVPSILHFLVILAFRRRVEIMPFIPLLVTDIMVLVVKGIKASYFPFEIEGDEEDDFSDLENI